MRRLLLTLLAALCLTGGESATIIVRPGGAMAMSGGGGGAPTYLIKQGFEGTGYDNSESWTALGTPDPDYTGTVLDGSQSFRALNGISGAKSPTFTAQSEAWFFFKIRIVSNSAQPWAFRVYSGGSVKYTIWFNGSRQMVMREDGSATSATTSDALALNTTYNVWAHYKKGTGANAIWEGSFSTTTTKPLSGTPYAIVSNGTGTSNIDQIQCGDDANDTPWEMIYDYVRVDDVNIGDNPS